MAKIIKGTRYIRPDLNIEYNSYGQLPFILLAMLRFRRKKATLLFMSGEHQLGKQKVIIKPRFHLKKVK